MRNAFLLSVVLGISVGSVAWAHGPQIQVDVVNNQIVTRGVAADTPDYTVLQPVTRAYSVDMFNVLGAWVSNYNTDDHTGPGFVVLQNRFAEGTQLRFNVLDEIKFWNGSGFASRSPEELEISRSSGTVFVDTGPSNPIAGFDIITSIANATVGQHREVRYTLLGDGSSPVAASADGAYLLKLELTNTNSVSAPTGVAASLPFYMLFNKNTDAPTAQAAFSFVQSNLVPEPGAGLLLCVGGLALVRRRRGAMFA